MPGQSRRSDSPEYHYAPTQKPQPIAPGPGRAVEPRPAAGGGPPRDRSRAATVAPEQPKRSRRRRRRRVPIGRTILVLFLALLLGVVGLVFYYDSQLNRVDALVGYAGRPADTPGTNWLIVGTDSRSDLSEQEQADLSTGNVEGARTDTIMLVHNPPSGDAMIVSIPRDLYVPIPGQGSHKINAAFNIGGPQLLVQTVENLTGVRIDHYAEIGFGGFDTLVDAVGGVDICLDQPIVDPKAGLNLQQGCQHLDGRQALGLVRTRAFDNADLARVVNQRKFLSALVAKATSPGVLLNPFRLVPFINGAVDALTVDEGDHIWNLAALAFAMRDPITTTTPTGGDQYTDDGAALVVGQNTEEFFGYLRAGQPVPEELIEDSGGAIN